MDAINQSIINVLKNGSGENALNEPNTPEEHVFLPIKKGKFKLKFPTFALPQGLQQCVKELADIHKMTHDVSMVAQSCIAAANISAQGIANVKYGKGYKPISLFFMTIADSGSGKSPIFDDAMRPICEYTANEKQQYDSMSKMYLEKMKEFRKWKEIAKKNNAQLDEEEPIMPMANHMINITNFTIEGLQRQLMYYGRPSICIASSRASGIIGDNLQTEKRTKYIRMLTNLFEGEPLTKVLAGNDHPHHQKIAFDKRLSLFWMVPPKKAYKFIRDSECLNQGIIAKFLINEYDDSKSGDIKLSDHNLDKLPMYKHYMDTIKTMLDLDIKPNTSYDINFKSIYLDPESHEMLDKFVEKTDKMKHT